MFGDLELRVLNALNNIREGTIRDILDEIIKISELEDSIKSNIPAYTTVATVLTRLANKHQVQVREERFRKNQIRLVYMYEDVESNVIDEMINNLVETFGSRAMIRLAERLTTEIDPEDLSKIKEKIQKHLEKEI
jgi:predicted transcriptional regulator